MITGGGSSAARSRAALAALLFALSAGLLLARAQQIDVFPDSLEFRTIPVGSSVNLTFEVFNFGQESPLVVSGVNISGPGAAAFSTPTRFPFVVNGGQLLSVVVTFTPSEPVTYVAAVRVFSNTKPSDHDSLTLEGTGAAYRRLNFTVDGAPRSQFAFNPVVSGGSSPPLRVEFRNPGSALVQVRELELRSAQPPFAPLPSAAAAFVIDIAPPITVPGDDSFVFLVTCSPPSAGAFAAMLWGRDVLGSVYNVTLTCTGLATPILLPSDELFFGSVAVGAQSLPLRVRVVAGDAFGNLSAQSVGIAQPSGTGNSSVFFLAPGQSPCPCPIPPAGSTTFLEIAVFFAPRVAAEETALLRIVVTSRVLTLSLRGRGVSAQSSLVVERINCGALQPRILNGSVWLADSSYAFGGSVATNSSAVFASASELQAVYEVERWFLLPPPHYVLPVSPGLYRVDLHFAEIFAVGMATGARVFNVLLEGRRVLENYDIFAAVGAVVPDVRSFLVDVRDDALEVSFEAETLFPKISGIVLSLVARLETVDAVDFGHIVMEQQASSPLRVLSSGSAVAAITSVRFANVSGPLSDLSLLVPGAALPINASSSANATRLADGRVEVALSQPVLIGPDDSTEIQLQVRPSAADSDVSYRIVVSLLGNFGERNFTVLANGVLSASHPFLHVVIRCPQVIVDSNGDGNETVVLDGADSHTHEYRRSVDSFTWQIASGNGVLLPPTTASSVTGTFSTGSHAVSLTIGDDNSPPQTLQGVCQFRVVAPSDVPGVLVRLYPVAALTVDPAALKASFAAVVRSLRFPEAANLPLPASLGRAVLRLEVSLELSATLGNYSFSLSGPGALPESGAVWNVLLVDGQPLNGGVAFEQAATGGVAELQAGRHVIDLRVAVNASELSSTQPLSLTVVNAGNGMATETGVLRHSQLSVDPVLISASPNASSLLGGTLVELRLFALNERNFSVRFGSVGVVRGENAALVDVLRGLVQVRAPASSTERLIEVWIESGAANGTTHESNRMAFEYRAQGPVPVTFDLGTLILPSNITLDGPTTADWAPDGRLVVGSLSGSLYFLSFDEDFHVGSVETLSLSSLSSSPHVGILGLAIDPFGSADDYRVYFSHQTLFINGGSCPGLNVPAPYVGFVSYVTRADNFSALHSVIRNLPVSNHDHGINGLQFDNDGALYVLVGSNTNAGVHVPQCYGQNNSCSSACNIGNLPETPLSAALLRARVRDADFNGDVVYIRRAGASDVFSVDDQRGGDSVSVAKNVSLEVFASGLRNAFDLVFTTRSTLYATDNGANSGFGPASLGASTDSGTDPNVPDSLVRVERGAYFGHPNRNRGLEDSRQNVFVSPLQTAVEGFTAPLAILDASTNGIAEYRASVFQGALLGSLLALKWNSFLYRVELSADGNSVARLSQSGASGFPSPGGLDVVTGPGGRILTIDYSRNRVRMLTPSDVSTGSGAALVYDIFPWRAPATGGPFPFRISGANLGSSAALVNVSFGESLMATVTRVTPTAIFGLVPPSPRATPNLVDVTVAVHGNAPQVLRAAFRYLGACNDAWQRWPPMPAALGEVAAAYVDASDLLIVVGEGLSETLSLDVSQQRWSRSALDARPRAGNHHAAVTFQDRVYLFGGLGAGAGGVQMLDPAAPRGSQWRLLPDMPNGACDGNASTAGSWAAGSVAAARIGHLAYVCGGIVHPITVPYCAVFNLVNHTWSTGMACMGRPSVPFAQRGRNHAAAGSDGRFFWVFGGRVGPNIVGSAFTEVHRFDPETNSWIISSDPGSPLAPMPFASGGLGAAVFYNGEFFVMGGESNLAPASNPGLSDRGVWRLVAAYRTSTNTWRTLAPMPTPRHGVFPVLARGSLIAVAGGGDQAGLSASAAVEAYCPDSSSSTSGGPRPQITSLVRSPTNEETVPLLVTFSEDVLGFSLADIEAVRGRVLAGSLAPLVGSRIFTLMGRFAGSSSLSLFIRGGACVGAQSFAPNQPSDVFSLAFDASRPVPSLLLDSSRRVSPLVVSIKWTKPIANFSVSDLVLVGAAVQSLQRQNASHFVLTAVPSFAEGNVSIRLPSGRVLDEAGNGNVAASLLVMFDAVSPTVALQSVSPSVTNQAPLRVRLEFSEPVAGFSNLVAAAAGLSISGGNVTGLAPIAPGTMNLSAAYEIAVTPAAPLVTVTISVAANAATDAAGNPSRASVAPIVIQFDTVPPECSFSVSNPPPTRVTPMRAIVTCNELVSRAVAPLVVVTNGTLGDAFAIGGGDSQSGDGSTVVSAARNWSLLFTPAAADVLVTVTLAAGALADLAGNGVAIGAQYVQRFDAVAPSVAIGRVTAADGAIELRATFSEPVSGFVLSNLTVTGAALNESSLSGLGAEYRFVIRPSANRVTVRVLPSAAVDAAGNVNSASATLKLFPRPFDPNVSLVLVSAAGRSPLRVAAVFNDSVSGFSAEDVEISGGVVASVSGSGFLYELFVNPNSSVTILALRVRTAAAENDIGRRSSASAELVIAHDSTAPIASLSSSLSAAATRLTELVANLSFTKNVTGLTEAALFASPGAVVAGSLEGQGSVYTLRVRLAAATAGDVATLHVAALSGNVVDAFGNSNPETATLDFSIDRRPPAAIITAEAGALVSWPSISVQVDFDEDVTGFDAGEDVSVTNAQVNSSLALSARSYQLVILPNGTDPVSIELQASAVNDIAGNGNEAASLLVSASGVGPNTTLSANVSSPFRDVAARIFVSFGDSVTGFDESDVLIEGGSVQPSSFSGSGASYQMVIVPNSTLIAVGGGLLVVRVPSGAAADGSARGSRASTPLRLLWDATRPSVTLVRGSSLNMSPLVVHALATEPLVAAPLSSDFLVTGAASVANVSGSGALFSISLVPAAPLQPAALTIALRANAVTDRAGHPNEMSGALSLAYDPQSPTVTLALSAPATSPTNAAPLNVSVNFSEPVSGFGAAGVVAAGGTVRLASLGGSAANYSLLIDPLDTQARVSLGALGRSAIDAAGNGNAQTPAPVDFEYDADPPQVILAGLLRSALPSVAVSVLLDEEVIGFSTASFQVTGGTLAPLESRGTGFVTTLTANGGQVAASVQVPAGVVRDAAGNGNSASNTLSVEFDTLLPILQIRANGSSRFRGSDPLAFVIDASEAVSLASSSLLIVDGGSLVSGSLVALNATQLQFSVLPAGGRNLFVQALPGLCEDALGNPSLSTSVSLVFDNTPPNITLSLVSRRSRNPLVFRVQFSEDLATNAAAVVPVVEGGVAALPMVPIGGRAFNLSVTPAQAFGNVTVYFAADAVFDLAGNGNLGSAPLQVLHDRVAPTATAQNLVGSPTAQAAIRVRLLFSKPVALFAESVLNVSGGAVASGSLAAESNSDGGESSGGGTAASFVLTLQPASPLGAVELAVPAAVTVDEAGNPNAASVPLTVQVDRVPPTFVLAATATRFRTRPVRFRLVFSEQVMGLNASRIDVQGGTLASSPPQSQDGNVSFTFGVEPSASTAVVTVALLGEAARDAAGNPSAASSSRSRCDFDEVAPAVLLYAPPFSNTRPIELVVTFSKLVSSFSGALVVVSGGSVVAGSFRAVLPGEAFRLELDPSGPNVNMTVSVPANASVDQFGNENLASLPLSVVYDAIRPRPAVILGTNGGAPAGQPVGALPFTVSVVFDEDVQALPQSALVVQSAIVVSISPAQARGRAFSIVLLATITSGSVAISVVGDGVRDLAGNGNVASNVLSVVVDAEPPTFAFLCLDCEFGRLISTSNVTRVRLTVSERVVTLNSSLVVVTGGVLLGFRSDDSGGRVFTLTIGAPGLGAVATGNVSISVGLGAFRDLAGNSNEAAGAPFLFTYERGLPRQRTSYLVTLTYDTPFPSDPALQRAIAARVVRNAASATGAPASRFDVVSVTRGSVVIALRVLPDANTSSVAAIEIVDALASAAAAVPSPLTVNLDSLNSPNVSFGPASRYSGAEAVELCRGGDWAAVGQCGAVGGGTTDTSVSVNLSPVEIVGVVAAVVLTLVLLIAVLVWCKRHWNVSRLRRPDGVLTHSSSAVSLGPISQRGDSPPPLKKGKSGTVVEGMSGAAAAGGRVEGMEEKETGDDSDLDDERETGSYEQLALHAALAASGDALPASSPSDQRRKSAELAVVQQQYTALQTYKNETAAGGALASTQGTHAVSGGFFALGGSAVGLTAAREGAEGGAALSDEQILDAAAGVPIGSALAEEDSGDGAAHAEVDMEGSLASAPAHAHDGNARGAVADAEGVRHVTLIVIAGDVERPVRYGRVFNADPDEPLIACRQLIEQQFPEIPSTFYFADPGPAAVPLPHSRELRTPLREVLDAAFCLRIKSEQAAARAAGALAPSRRRAPARPVGAGGRGGAGGAGGAGGGAPIAGRANVAASKVAPPKSPRTPRSGRRT